MRCANCGTELLEGKKFCHACGTRVAVEMAAGKIDPKCTKLGAIERQLQAPRWRPRIPHYFGVGE